MDHIKAGGFKLNKQQRSAFRNIVDFVDRKQFVSDKMYLLSGYAGTGKSTILTRLRKHFKHHKIVYTAPTNKATKVLRKFLGKEAECRTIFSLLGIKMVTNEDAKKIEFPKIPSDLSEFDIIVVDEVSMVNEVLYDYINLRAQRYPAKWILLGDDVQIPPVGEEKSKVWLDDLPRSRLTKVMRYDNEILALATHIRKQIKRYPEVELVVKSNHSNKQGVWKMGKNAFIESVEKAASGGHFTNTDDTKVIAWRNATVDKYNDIIRKVIYGDIADANEYMVGERILVAEPVHNPQGVAVAHIDDEGTVISCEVSYHVDYKEFDCWRITIKIDSGPLLVVNVIHKDSVDALRSRLNELALEAKKDPRKWKYFWVLHYSFHKLRYSYCITAHRSQASTYINAFVDMKDILDNSNSLEALQCFYVAGTRPTTILVIT